MLKLMIGKRKFNKQFSALFSVFKLPLDPHENIQKLPKVKGTRRSQNLNGNQVMQKTSCEKDFFQRTTLRITRKY